jgi:hypothetical protein
MSIFESDALSPALTRAIAGGNNMRPPGWAEQSDLHAAAKCTHRRRSIQPMAAPCLVAPLPLDPCLVLLVLGILSCGAGAQSPKLGVWTWMGGSSAEGKFCQPEGENGFYSYCGRPGVYGFSRIAAADSSANRNNRAWLPPTLPCCQSYGSVRIFIFWKNLRFRQVVRLLGIRAGKTECGFKTGARCAESVAAARTGLSIPASLLKIHLC